LLLFESLFALSNRTWIYAAPLLLTVPRIILQLMPQVLGIVTGWK